MHILIVEDEVRLARQIASALTEAGHDPTVVHDGEGALQEATDTPFDLIVLDVGLPHLDGFEVLRHLRARHDVVESAYASASSRFYPHRVVRTRLGTRTRIRYETGRSFHRTVAQENWRSPIDSYGASRRLHD